MIHHWIHDQGDSDAGHYGQRLLVGRDRAASGFADGETRRFFRVARVPAGATPASVRLYQLADEPGDRFVYVYDFGDSWEHDVVLEDMKAAETPLTPICLDGERAAPPEDCGGVSGYAQLVEALRDPSHPDHADLKRWAGKYDPDALDLELINRRLARLSRGRARG